MKIKLMPTIRGDSNFLKLFPSYIVQEYEIRAGPIKHFYYGLLLFLLRVILIIYFKAYHKGYRKLKNKKELTNKDVEGVYTREAKTYEHKHHFISGYRDTWWRRQVGLDIVDHCQKQKQLSEELKVLDVATGIGLSLEEILKISKLFNIGICVTGLDFNQAMLSQGKKTILSRIQSQSLLKNGVRNVQLVRGDAMQLTSYFNEQEFDVVSTIFGIGGISQPLKALTESLKVLKDDGILILIDVHKPILALDEHWPRYIGNKDGPYFSLMGWNKVTKPFVLKEIWGWRDPTPIFYLAQYLVYYNKRVNKYYGFEKVSLSINNEYWWFRLPITTTAKIILRKKEINKDQYLKNKNLISSIKF